MIRVRKFSPIDREHPIFEAVEGDIPLFDVGMTDDGKLEICFNSPIGGRLMPLDDFQAALSEAVRLASDTYSN